VRGRGAVRVEGGVGCGEKVSLSPLGRGTTLSHSMWSSGDVDCSKPFIFNNTKQFIHYPNMSEADNLVQVTGDQEQRVGGGGGVDLKLSRRYCATPMSTLKSSTRFGPSNPTVASRLIICSVIQNSAAVPLPSVAVSQMT
jgi:hypothetical protein